MPSEYFRICFITAFPPQKKGEAEYALHYVNALIKYHKNIEIDVLSQTSKRVNRKTKDIIEPNGKIRIWSAFDSDSILQRNLSFLKIFEKIIRVKPRIVHVTYGPNTDYGGRMGEPLLLLFLCLKLQHIPTVVTLHSTWLQKDVKENAQKLGHGRLLTFLATLYFSFFTRAFTRLVDKVLVLTTKEDSQITRAYIATYGLPKKKIGEELHGCDFSPTTEIEVLQAKDRLGLKDKRVILSFGLIRDDKGFEYLINAFFIVQTQVQRCILLIVGSPITVQDKFYLNSLLTLVRSLGLEKKVMFVNRYVDEKELLQYVDSSDLVVFPYVRSVGPSGSLYYALSRGKPAIVTDTGYMGLMKDVVVLVSPKDSSGLATEMLSLLLDKRFRNKTIMDGLAYSELHDWSIVSERNINVYGQVMETKP